VLTEPDGTFYPRLGIKDMVRVIDAVSRGEVVEDLLWLDPDSNERIRAQWDVPFFRAQTRTLLSRNERVDPIRIHDYIENGGYAALVQVLEIGDPAWVVAEVKASGLRGRGGAGFPTGQKWEMLSRQRNGHGKYLVCNADEGDPGAYMDRSVLEGNPHSIIEGMLIGAFATGATGGVIYVRTEYPLAIKHLVIALRQARELGLLGAGILGTGFSFDIQIVKGAGSFVCGEETALMRSVEGERGEPRQRPPYPVQKGIQGKPTAINNVETWANIPIIINSGAAEFAATGTPHNTGTKIFSLVGKARNTGLVEIPMGVTIGRIVHEIGGGASGRARIKAVQTGGPSGGCIPAALFDLPIDYESLARAGSIMGSGGMIVMDDDTCMVDVAKYFMRFLKDESCGKCFTCRKGTQRMWEILDDITAGRGSVDQLDLLEELAHVVKDTTLCGLGQTASNPVLSTLRHFRREFEDHIRERRCRAGVCEALAASPCENTCPLHMNTPRYLQLLKEDRFDDAFLSVLLDNPLPATTGRVCQHPCEDHCRRAGLDASVNMREVHRYIADAAQGSERFEELAGKVAARRLPATGRKCAVVGAGPAGLTCAYYLALLGHEVMVYDCRPLPGGMLRYALPEYRLPKAVLDKEIEIIRGLGVKFTGGMAIPDQLTLDELDALYDAVFLATGTWREAWIYLPGSELKGVFPALPWLERIARKQPVEAGRRVVVIGGGNAAVDAARTALRLGAEVKILYRRERKDMPAIPEEIEAAESEGVEIFFLSAPHRIAGDGEGRVDSIEMVKTRLGEFDASGRRRPLSTDEIVRFECDTVILAIGETGNVDFAKASGLKSHEDGLIDADRYTLETSRRKFYAGGDLVSGSANVSTAMGYGKKAARNIDERLMGASRWEMLYPGFSYDQSPPQHPSESGRHRLREIDSKLRAKDFAEPVAGISAAEAKEEACRCLRCDIKTVEEATL
jgi:NADH-quinone oxidoreductase subunit F